MNKALAGVNILDFTWVIAGPVATKLMGEHGATVVRVESSQRLDIHRAYVLYSGGNTVNHCVSFAYCNNDKLGIALNVTHPGAGPVIERLVRWADIVIENFTPGTLEQWKLGNEELRKLNPDIIVIRTSLFGQTGPYAHQRGFGTMMQAQAGFTSLVGWPDRSPVGTTSPYTDFVAPWYVVSLALAAIDHRRRTGEGQCIDLSQLEAGLHFLAPLLLDGAANNRVWPSRGNHDPAAAPHGIFRCLGDDRWCAIAVFDDLQWRGLCHAMNDPAWTAEPAFASFPQRKQNETELEERIEAWTATLPAEKVMQLLQDRAVPAGIVANGKDLHEDPQLAHRQHLVRLPHVAMGPLPYDAASFRLSLTPGSPSRSSPCLGEHTEYVCRELLGMSDDEFVALVTEGVFE